MNFILKIYSPKITYIKNGGLTENILNFFPIYVINCEEDIH